MGDDDWKKAKKQIVQNAIVFAVIAGIFWFIFHAIGKIFEWVFAPDISNKARIIRLTVVLAVVSGIVLFFKWEVSEVAPLPKTTVVTAQPKPSVVAAQPTPALVIEIPGPTPIASSAIEEFDRTRSKYLSKAPIPEQLPQQTQPALPQTATPEVNAISPTAIQEAPTAKNSEIRKIISQNPSLKNANLSLFITTEGDFDGEGVVRFLEDSYKQCLARQSSSKEKERVRIPQRAWINFSNNNESANKSLGTSETELKKMEFIECISRGMQLQHYYDQPSKSVTTLSEELKIAESKLTEVYQESLNALTEANRNNLLQATPLSQDRKSRCS